MKTKKELLKHIAKQYPEYSPERTELIYDKEAHTPTLMGLPNGVDVLEYAVQNVSDAGLYTLSASFSYDAENSEKSNKFIFEEDSEDDVAGRGFRTDGKEDRHQFRERIRNGTVLRGCLGSKQVHGGLPAL